MQHIGRISEEEEEEESEHGISRDGAGRGA